MKIRFLLMVIMAVLSLSACNGSSGHEVVVAQHGTYFEGDLWSDVHLKEGKYALKISDFEAIIGPTKRLAVTVVADVSSINRIGSTMGTDLTIGLFDKDDIQLCTLNLSTDAVKQLVSCVNGTQGDVKLEFESILDNFEQAEEIFNTAQTIKAMTSSCITLKEMD